MWDLKPPLLRCAFFSEEMAKNSDIYAECRNYVGISPMGVGAAKHSFLEGSHKMLK